VLGRRRRSVNCIHTDGGFVSDIQFQCLNDVFGSSGAGVAQSVLCLTKDWTTGVRSPTETEDFCVQTGSGAHPASYPMGTGGGGGPFPGGKARVGRDADYAPPTGAEVKND
jgi:hypothetical protein